MTEKDKVNEQIALFVLKKTTFWASFWENRIFAFAKTKTLISLAKTKALISFAVTAKLISVFVFATCRTVPLLL